MGSYSAVVFLQDLTKDVVRIDAIPVEDIEKVRVCTACLSHQFFAKTICIIPFSNLTLFDGALESLSGEQLTVS
jgi:hypothetical protein